MATTADLYQWANAMNSQSDLANDVNPRINTQTYYRDMDTLIAPNDTLRPVIDSAVKAEYQTPSNFINQSNKYLEGQLDNPTMYKPVIGEKSKAKLLDMLYPKIKA